MVGRIGEGSIERVNFEVGFDRVIEMEEVNGLLFLGGSPGHKL